MVANAFGYDGYDSYELEAMDEAVHYPRSMEVYREATMKATEAMQRCFQPWQWFIDRCPGGDGHTEGKLMWVYRPAEDGHGFLVGFFYPDHTWFTDSVYRGEDAKSKAADRVRWLNGG